MAVYLRGLSERELADLTEIMLASGDRIPLDDVPGTKIDKHSTGGVGDKISFVVAPLVAACGVRVPMLSGRGLGHTGGTLDKLEAIPGMNVFLTPGEIRGVLAETGMVICGQTDAIVPADKKIYALRDATATVGCIPLIASSIMSKKLALGTDGIVLDVKTGSGAFMKDEQDALRLCRAMVAIGEKTGRPTLGIISSMDQPLGRAVGNSLEIIESIEALKGPGPGGHHGGHLRPRLLHAAGGGTDDELCGGRREVPGGHRFGPGPRGLPALHRRPGRRSAGLRRLFPAARPPRSGSNSRLRASGFIEAIDAFSVGMAAIDTGAGRRVKEDTVALRKRLRLPGQRRRQGRKRPDARDRPQRPPRTDCRRSWSAWARRSGSGPGPWPAPKMILHLVDKDGVRPWPY